LVLILNVILTLEIKALFLNTRNKEFSPSSLVKIIIALNYKLPLHCGLNPLHPPSVHVMVLSPSSSKPRWHLKLTELPCRKLFPVLLPLLGTPGSEHGAKNIV